MGKRLILFNVSVVIFATLFFGFFQNAEARHLKLYGPQRPEKGVTWMTYVNDYIPSSSIPTATGDVGNVMYHEIEIETGITERWSQSIYFDGDSQSGSPVASDNNFRVNLIKTEFNISVFESRWFDFRLNNEWAFKSGNYTEPLSQEKYSDSTELRTIFSKSIDSFAIIISPGFFYRYTDDPLGLTYFYANAIQYGLSDKVTLGLEFHGDLGEMKTASEQSHYIVPNIDIQLHEKALLSIGVGVGLNEQAEKYTFRNSLQLSYQW